MKTVTSGLFLLPHGTGGRALNVLMSLQLDGCSFSSSNIPHYNGMVRTAWEQNSLYWVPTESSDTTWNRRFIEQLITECSLTYWYILKHYLKKKKEWWKMWVSLARAMQPPYWPFGKQQPRNPIEAMPCPSVASCGQNGQQKATIWWSQRDCTAFHLHRPLERDFIIEEKQVGNIISNLI